MTLLVNSERAIFLFNYFLYIVRRDSLLKIILPDRHIFNKPYTDFPVLCKSYKICKFIIIYTLHGNTVNFRVKPCVVAQVYRPENLIKAFASCNLIEFFLFEGIKAYVHRAETRSYKSIYLFRNQDTVGGY